MSEFDEKLNALLSDPDRMSQIMQMAQSLSGSFAQPTGEKSPPQTELVPPFPQAQQPEQNSAAPTFDGDILSSLMGGLDPSMLLKLVPLIRELGGDSSTNARTLLYALRPYLKPERQERIERSLQLAKLLRIGRKFITNWEG